MIKKEKIKKFKMLVIMGMIAAVFLMGARFGRRNYG